MASKKHYIIVSLTLGIIAAASAGLIGLTNLLTANQIAQNEQNKINAGITALFGEDASIAAENEITGYKYTNYEYQVSSPDNTEDYALRTTGSNMYGKISLLVGFRYMVGPEGSGTPIAEYVFTGLYVITNEQTYASTLEDNYIDPLNDGDVDLDDVSCGATYGATLIRDMVNEAQSVVDARL